jgi:ceramide glucosyltransferase
MHTSFHIATLANVWRILLLIASIGIAASTVFLGMALVAGQRYRRRARLAAAVAQNRPRESFPSVTVLKPVHGMEPRLEQNLESFFLQDYPNFEIVFGTRSEEDPALQVVDRLRQRYPDVPVRVVFSGQPTWPNAKVFSLNKMIATSADDYFVISDSDILVQPDFLRNVISPLLEKQNGLVTCLYQGVPAEDFWSGLEALGMSVEMPSGVIVADMMEGMQFALGAVMAVRRDALDKIGGIVATSEYYSDDFVLGHLIANAGYTVVLSHHKVGHVLTTQTFAQTFKTQRRWMQSTRYSRRLGHLGSGLTFSTPFGLLGFISAGALGHWHIALALLGWSYFNRVIQALAVGWGVIRDQRALAGCLLYPLRDLLGFVVWTTSYLGGSTFYWRGEVYRFTAGGRIVPERRKVEAVSTVA